MFEFNTLDMQDTLQLISFKLCPFVQRSVILLNYKKVKYKLKYIDIKHKPDWFLALSPLGKVPVLKVDDTILFESTVISEYLDETITPQLHPSDALRKAQHRAWIEFSSSLFTFQYKLLLADNSDALEDNRQALQVSLTTLSEQCDEKGPFFASDKISLVDISIAPFFMRMDIIESKTGLKIYPNQRIKNWAAALANMPSVQQSVVDDFEALFIASSEKQGSYLFLAYG